MGAIAAKASRAGSVLLIVIATAPSPAVGVGGDDEREALLGKAEAALAASDSTTAAAVFERAAGLLHAADTEMGQVRTAMQQGRYRQALAFCAHTAGAHPESAPAGALYAWLLRVGGQVPMSDRVLAQTLARSPDDPVARATQHAFADPWLLATGPLLSTPHRLAPLGIVAAASADGVVPVAAQARVVASGVLIDGGRRALVPLASIPAVVSAANPPPAASKEFEAPGSSPNTSRTSTMSSTTTSPSASTNPIMRRLWLRNGLGQTTSAAVDNGSDSRADATRRRLAELGVGVLQLDTALPFDAAVDAPAAHDPFAGSPAFVITYTAGDDMAAPAWPWLRQGFFGGLAGGSGDDRIRQLGIDLPDGPHGGLVMDARGRVAGLALPGPHGAARFVPVSLWHGLGGSSSDHTAPSPLASKPASPGGLALPADAAYERGLRLTLQLIVAAP